MLLRRAQIALFDIRIVLLVAEVVDGRIQLKVEILLPIIVQVQIEIVKVRAIVGPWLHVCLFFLLSCIPIQTHNKVSQV